MRAITATLLLFLSISFLGAQGIFDDSIHQADTVGNVSSPALESVQQVIDQDEMTKYLDFNIEDGIGFEVDLGSGAEPVATSMSFTTANDAPERDPTNYEIFGSNDGMSYTSIATGMIPCVADRFLTRIFTFSNTNGYSIYRLIFTGTCNTSTINQIADVQLFVTTGNAPVFSCPDNIVISNTPGECSGVANYEVSVTDMEDGGITPTLILGEVSGGTFDLGTTPVVYSVADSDGNGVSCEFFVTVEDTETPSFVCPDDLTIGVAPGQMGAEVDFSVLATDNCSPIVPLDGFTELGTIDGFSYYVSDSLFTPEAANDHAFANGGVPGTIRSQSDNDYLVNAIAVNVNEPIDVLIGYSDVLFEDSWIWASGDGSTYTNWNAGEPNNSGAGGEPENYVVLLNNGFWNDVAGDPLVYRYLLEREFEVVQTDGLESGSNFPLGTTVNTFTVGDAAGNIAECSFDVTVEVSTNVEELAFSNNLELLPNPNSTGEIFIRSSTTAPVDKVIVYDLFGKVISVFEFTNGAASININISNLQQGVYLLRINSGSLSATKKLIKS